MCIRDSDGTMFVDHISVLKRELIRKRMKRLKTDRAAAKEEAEGASASV